VVSELFWPGDHRAGDHLTPRAFLEAIVDVEEAWLAVLGVEGVSLHGDLDDWLDVGWGREIESGGNPVIAVVSGLRGALVADQPEAARWLHRGLTSQDVVDTALMTMVRDAVADLVTELRRLVRRLAELAREHRDTPMVARTLTQHAVPTTMGLKAATWLTGVLDAGDDLKRLTFPVQLGGAAGTQAAVVELGHDPAAARAALAGALGLADSPPWHTARRPVTRIADALVACTDAWGRIAADVLTLSRPEIGELTEGTGGGSSTMPNKANPVLSTLVRRAALTTPQLAATLHLAAAEQVDERADGAWHVEWDTLRLLVRRALVAGAQTADLLDELRVHPDRMAATLATARDDVLAEQRTMADLAGHEPAGDYLGAAGGLVDEALARARTHLEETA
jgi:3-carboxy-cis,cis-muconate cycloisomerase